MTSGAWRARLLATATLLLTAPAYAAEAPAEHEGMPQLNFATPLTISQVVWMAIIFFALYLLLSRWALPQVAEVIDSRAASIAADLETARVAKMEADAAANEVDRTSRQAHAEAQAEINEAASRAKHAAEERAAGLAAKLDAQLAEAETRISAARAEAMGALRQVAGDTTTLVVSRLTGRAPDPSRVEQAVGDVLAARAA